MAERCGLSQSATSRIEIGEADRVTVANLLAQHALSLGCPDPVIAARLAYAVAASERTGDLQAALALALPVMAKRRGNTGDGWRELANAVASIRSRLARGGVRYSGKRDETGNPIPIRRHHPAVPRRPRATRLLRAEIAPPPLDPPIAHPIHPAIE